MITMGIDVGQARPGVSVVEFTSNFWRLDNSRVLFSGFNETEKEKGKVATDDIRRISENSQWLAALIRKYRPGYVFIEMPTSGGRSAFALKCMALAAGYTVATVQLCIEDQCKVIYFSPYETKKSCTGDGYAEKDQMISAALIAWPDVEFPLMKAKKGKPAKVHEDKASAMADSLCTILTYVRANFDKPIL